MLKSQYHQLTCDTWQREVGVNIDDCTASDTAVESGSKNRVFGVSLNKCLRRDAERHGGRVPVLPSSESSLLDALSLQSASASRLTLTPRLSAQQLYDEHYCSTQLHVPQIVRTCCHHLKTHGNVLYTVAQKTKPPYSLASRMCEIAR